jgi:predicted benzoate:H+ symporter BenE
MEKDARINPRWASGSRPKAGLLLDFVLRSVQAGDGAMQSQAMPHIFSYSLLVKRRSRTWGVLVVLEPEDVVMQVILAAQGDEVQKRTKQLRG